MLIVGGVSWGIGNGKWSGERHCRISYNKNYWRHLEQLNQSKNLFGWYKHNFVLKKSKIWKHSEKLWSSGWGWRRKDKSMALRRFCPGENLRVSRRWEFWRSAPGATTWTWESSRSIWTNTVLAGSSMNSLALTVPDIVALYIPNFPFHFRNLLYLTCNG